MKNFIKFLSIGSFCFALLNCAACSKEDEPQGGDGGTVVEINGKRISGIDDYSVEYDNEGRPTSISTRYSDLIINYKKGTIQRIDTDGDETETINVKFSDGYISSFSQSWNYKDSYYQEKGSGKAEFKYSKGYLTQIKIHSEGEEKDFEDGTTEKFKASSEAKMTWKDGNMVSYICNGTETEGKETDKWTVNYSYSYGAQANIFKQMPICISESWADESDFAILAALGLFGKGTSFFPTGMNYTETYDGDTDSYDYRVDISLNADGSISQESFRHNYINYYYEDLTRAESIEGVVPFKPLFSVFRNHK